MATLITLPMFDQHSNTSYIKAGQGQAILFIHGVGLCADAWQQQIDTLERQASLYAIDLPGHGNSPPLHHAEADLMSYCQQVKLFIDHVIDDSVILVGHSLGALIAVEMAALYPKSIKGVIAISGVYQRSPEAVAAVLARAQQLATSPPDHDSSYSTLIRWFGENPSNEHRRMAEQCQNWLNQSSRAGYAAAYSVFAAQSGVKTESLEKLAIPCLFITGTNDPNSTPRMSEQMAQAVQAGEACIINEARHMLQMTHADEVNNEIARFIKLVKSADTA